MLCVLQIYVDNSKSLELSTDLTSSFLKSAGLRLETEGFVFAYQDGVIITLAYRARYKWVKTILKP